MTSDMLLLYRFMLRAGAGVKVTRAAKLTSTGTAYMFRLSLPKVGHVSVALAPERNRASEYEKYL